MWMIFKIRYADKTREMIPGLIFSSESDAFLKAKELGYGYSYGKVAII